MQLFITYHKTEVPSSAYNHIPVDLYSIQGIPLKRYTVRCYTSIPKATGSIHYCKEQCHYD